MVERHVSGAESAERRPKAIYFGGAEATRDRCRRRGIEYLIGTLVGFASCPLNLPSASRRGEVNWPISTNICLGLLLSKDVNLGLEAMNALKKQLDPTMVVLRVPLHVPFQPADDGGQRLFGIVHGASE